MYLSKLKLYQFRNISDVILEFSKTTTIICGNNGHGKTNLVEAIHLLSATKSFRTSNSKECIQWGKDACSIHGNVQENIGNFDISVIVEKRSKKYLINNEEVKPSSFVGKLITITFSPNDIQLVKGEPSLRRNFLDKHLVDYKPSILKSILSYTKALKTKNELLDKERPDIELESWDEILADNAFEIEKYRREFVSKLNQKYKEVFEKFAQADGESDVSLLSPWCPEDLSRQNILTAIKNSYLKDRIRKKVTIGPQKDDLLITASGIDSRKFSSQGQAKSLAIALKLSLIELIKSERNDTPIVVLDDVDSELDSTRLNKLYEAVLEKDTQVFITGTEIHEGLKKYKENITVYNVDSGRFNSD